MLCLVLAFVIFKQVTKGNYGYSSFKYTDNNAVEPRLTELFWLTYGHLNITILKWVCQGNDSSRSRQAGLIICQTSLSPQAWWVSEPVLCFIYNEAVRHCGLYVSTASYYSRKSEPFNVILSSYGRTPLFMRIVKSRTLKL